MQLSDRTHRHPQVTSTQRIMTMLRRELDAAQEKREQQEPTKPRRSVTTEWLAVIGFLIILGAGCFGVIWILALLVFGKWV